MSEFDSIFKGEFFIINSDELRSVETKLYGYFIDNGELIRNENFSHEIPLPPNGSYIYVKKTDEKISIYQDFDGCYGIYLFQDSKGNFCISNSFIYLVDNVKHRYPISLNENYAKSYLTSKVCSFAYKQTLINEIEMIPRNFVMHIHLNTKKIEYEKINYHENSIPLNSKEGIDVLDDWFYRWTSLFHNLKNQTNNIQVDLSGGFDTRVVLSLLLSSGIDLNEINVNSFNDGKHVHDEDFKIASEIANEFNFKLNNRKNLDNKRYYFKDLETSINISFYTKLGYHNQMGFPNHKNIHPFYKISGTGGEIIRGFSMDTTDSLLERAKEVSQEFVEPTYKILKYNIENLKKDFGNEISYENINYIQYREIRRRYHFSRGNVEMYLSNIINFSPLTDAYLNKLITHDENCNDKQLLIALIFIRYCPELLDFDFQGGRKIDEKTIQYAKDINNKYPFIKKEIKSKNIYETVTNNLQANEETYNLNDINTYMKGIFYSNGFEKTFQTYFSSDIYNDIKFSTEFRKYFPLQYIYPTFAILKIINDVNISNDKKDMTLFEWLNHFTELPTYERLDYSTLRLLLNYLTARIDIINFGDENNTIELINCSDSRAEIIDPIWLKSSDGYGSVIQSQKGHIDLLIKCVGNGKLRITLRGRDIYDKNKKRFPIYIDFLKLIINDKNILYEPELTWHDDPYIHWEDIHDGELISIHVEWKPFDRNSIWKK